MRLVLALLAFPLLIFAQECAIDGIAVNAAGGAPIPRVNVSVISSKGAATSRADDNGRWHFSNMECGAFLVNGSRPGFVQNVLHSGRDRKASEGTLVSGSPIHDFRLEMIPQAVLTGKVIDDH